MSQQHVPLEVFSHSSLSPVLAGIRVVSSAMDCLNVPADIDNGGNNGNDDWDLPLSGGSTSEGLWKAGPCTPRPPPPSPIPLPQAAPGFWPHLPRLVTPRTPPGQQTTHYQAITQHNEV